MPARGGGETRFCNMYAALETLPGDLRRAIDGKTLKHEKVHSSDGTIRAGLKDPGTDDVRRISGPIHPMIMRTMRSAARPAMKTGSPSPSLTKL